MERKTALKTEFRIISRQKTELVPLSALSKGTFFYTKTSHELYRVLDESNLVCVPPGFKLVEKINVSILDNFQENIMVEPVDKVELIVS